jgi:hypothetical protein
MRFPGQYFMAETGLNQNVQRDYDALTVGFPCFPRHRPKVYSTAFSNSAGPTNPIPTPSRTCHRV